MRGIMIAASGAAAVAAAASSAADKQVGPLQTPQQEPPPAAEAEQNDAGIAAPADAGPVTALFFTVCGPAMEDLALGRESADAAGLLNMGGSPRTVWPEMTRVTEHVGAVDGVNVTIAIAQIDYPDITLSRCELQAEGFEDPPFSHTEMEAVAGFSGPSARMGSQGLARRSRVQGDDVITLTMDYNRDAARLALVRIAR